MLVRLHMTREVVTFGEAKSARSALQVLRAGKFRHAPVLRDGRLVGIVTERDLLRVLPWEIGQIEKSPGPDGATSTVGRAMTPDPLTARPNDGLDDIAEVFLQRRIGGLPVMQDGALVGIVTTSDVMQAFSDVLLEGRGRRIMLLCMPGRAPATSYDPVATAVKLDLVVESYLKSPQPNGGVVVIAGLLGTEQQLACFYELSADAGYLLIERPQAA